MLITNLNLLLYKPIPIHSNINQTNTHPHTNITMQTPKQPSFFTIFFITLFSISLYIPFTTSAACNYDDKITLFNLKAFFGKTDKFLTNWEWRYDCCYWNGVGCDEDGRVVSLSLRLDPADRSSSRQFQIPPDIKDLDQLKYLNLSVNGGAFIGGIDRALAQLFELEVLELSGNQLEGTIPGFLGDSLENLKYIDLSRNKLSGRIPGTLGHLRILLTLNLASNQLTGPVPNNLANNGLRPLQTLNLANNKLNGSIPDTLGQLPFLFTLDLASNQLTGPIPKTLGDTSRPLETLNLANNKLNGSIPIELGRLRRLKKLYLQNNRLNGSIPDELGSAPLKKLDLSGNQLCGAIPYVLANVFPAQSFRYNKCLCGKPLNNVCPKMNLGQYEKKMMQLLSTLVE